MPIFQITRISKKNNRNSYFFIQSTKKIDYSSLDFLDIIKYGKARNITPPIILPIVAKDILYKTPDIVIFELGLIIPINNKLILATLCSKLDVTNDIIHQKIIINLPLSVLHLYPHQVARQTNILHIIPLHIISTGAKFILEFDISIKNFGMYPLFKNPAKKIVILLLKNLLNYLNSI